MAKNPKPTAATVVKWRQMAEAGHTYAAIQRKYPRYTVNQIRHYCLGNTGRKLPGPLQEPGRWRGRNVWLQGEKSPHAAMTESQALQVLNDWDDAKGWWAHSAAYWAKVFKVSPSAIQQLRRGDTWTYLEHPNQGRAREKPRRAAAGKGVTRTAAGRAKGAQGRGAGKGSRQKAAGVKARAVSPSPKSKAGGKKAERVAAGKGTATTKTGGAKARGRPPAAKKGRASGKGAAKAPAPRPRKAASKGRGAGGKGRSSK